MKEQLISLKSAKLAKEKGFNLSKFEETISVPPQGLLQKWLREIHNIHIIIQPFKGEYGWRGLIGEKNKEPINISGFGGLEKTYEKALEEGLYQALKLIKLQSN